MGVPAGGVAIRPVRVLLVGMMGSGKTTVGRHLASRLGWSYADNDELVERATGRTAKELQEAGLEALRAAESAALSEALLATTTAGRRGACGRGGVSSGPVAAS